VLRADSWSDPRDESGYSAEDLLSLGFSTSPPDAALVQKSIGLADADLDSLRCVLPRRRPGQDHRVVCHATRMGPRRTGRRASLSPISGAIFRLLAVTGGLDVMRS